MTGSRRFQKAKSGVLLALFFVSATAFPDSSKRTSHRFYVECALHVGLAANFVRQNLFPISYVASGPLKSAPDRLSLLSPEQQERVMLFYFEKLLGKRWSRDLELNQVHWFLGQAYSKIENTDTRSLFRKFFERYLIHFQDDRAKLSLLLPIVFSSPLLWEELSKDQRRTIREIKETDFELYRDAWLLVLSWQVWSGDVAAAVSTIKYLRSFENGAIDRRLFVFSLTSQSKDDLTSQAKGLLLESFDGIESAVTKTLKPRELIRWQLAREVFLSRPSLPKGNTDWFLEMGLVAVVDSELKRKAQTIVSSIDDRKTLFIQYVDTDDDLQRQGFSKATLAAQILIHPEASRAAFYLAETNLRVFQTGLMRFSPNGTIPEKVALMETPLYRVLRLFGFSEVTTTHFNGRRPYFTVDWAVPLGE